jgi:hypothetical protein
MRAAHAAVIPKQAAMPRRDVHPVSAPPPPAIH